MTDPDKDPQAESLTEDELDAVAGGIGPVDGAALGEAGLGEAI